MAALNVDEVISQAYAMADLDGSPDIGFRSNLELLVDCLNREASLTEKAAGKVQTQLAEPLRNQLEVADWVERYPEIRNEQIERPILLTGLPRSGTTYFQYLFDPEPSMRMLRYWEGQRPCPPPGLAPDTIEDRIADCAAEKAQAKGDPVRAKIAQIHLSDADGPEECLKILDQTFANVGHLWTYSVPSYFARCLDTVDLRATYEHYKLVLQLLQWRGARKRWFLKWPCHLVALDEILDVFPDASFVVTHRDPVQALASNCSLAAILRRGTSTSVDPEMIGQQMKRMIHTYLERLVEFDRRHGEKIAHVDYTMAVNEPERAMAMALDSLGIEMTPGFAKAIAAWRRENPPGKRGTHHYSLEDYGLDGDAVAAEYAFYIDRFNVPTNVAAGS